VLEEEEEEEEEEEKEDEAETWNDKYTFQGGAEFACGNK
jgi:hypothetical protein